MAETLVVKDGEPIVDDAVVDDDVVIDDAVIDNDQIVDDDDGDDGDDEDDDKKLDWLEEEDDDQSSSDSMPVSAHIRAKRKLKGKIGDRDSEIEELRKEIEELKATKVVLPKDNTLVRPREEDFTYLEEYHQALEEYEDKRLENKLSVVQQQQNLREGQTQAVKKLGEAVDAHYERASKLIEENGISADTYRQTDEIVRNAIEAVKPNQGNIIVDQMISLLGNGSEKVLYKLGRNSALRNELVSLLIEDPNGLKATAFLGEQKAKISLAVGRRSNAPAPSNELDGGDAAISSKERVFKKKYNEAHSKGNSQAAYNAKKAAREGGIDTSSW